MKSVHKKVLTALLFFILGTAVFSYEMLIGITYFVDDEGRFYPEGEGAVDGYGAPFIGIIGMDENYKEAAIYYLESEGERIEQVTYSELSDSYYYRVVQFDSPHYGPITLYMGDEVIVDELGAVVASYRVQSRGKWFTAVGVVATEEHQSGQEQLEEFQEIIDEFLSEIEQMQ
jgi:hypothetical protein